MLFHSFDFIIFFIVVYVSLILIIKVGIIYDHQNNASILSKWWLLLTSYFFYAYWDYRFLPLILASTWIAYFSAIGIHKENNLNRKKLYLTASLCGNLGILGFFKYYNFFVESANLFLSNVNLAVHHLNIILPIGISFFIFQSISYVIDVFRERIDPSKNFLEFSLYIGFFPQLLAGPIVRARCFLPQVSKHLNFTIKNLHKGVQIFLFGLFLKLVIADNIATIIDPVFDNPENYDPLSAWIAIVGFSFQILCDFWGYSDMAIGMALILGFELPSNFKTPYLSTNLFNFWRRWHISLSSWLRDYLYIPLGGNKKGHYRTCCNVFITMALGGMWHGATWNFMLWGIYHGAGLLINKIVNILDFKILNGLIGTAFGWLFTYSFICFGWVLFRGQNMEIVRVIFLKLFFIDASSSSLSIVSLGNLFFLPCMLGIHACLYISKKDTVFFKEDSVGFYFQIIFIMVLVFFFAPLDTASFIYFQF
jgi:alginate O-acetyltransferase complex protein AlgI